MEKFVNIEPPPPGVIYEEDFTSTAKQMRTVSQERNVRSAVPRKSMEQIINQYHEDDNDLED